MNQLKQLFKKYASGVLLLLILLSPLQSSAALLAGDVAVLQTQAELLTQAIDSSTSITEAKKTELRELVTQIESIIAVLALQVESDPNAVSQRRLNIEDIIVTGDAKDFDSQVQIVWGPETVGTTVYERSTSTHNYDFVTSLAQDDKLERLSELSRLTFSQLAAEVGFSSGQLKRAANISFKRFDNSNDALDNYNPPSAGLGLEMYFGQYSIIDNAYVTSGANIFSITAETDQDETVRLTLSPNESNSKYTYRISYATYDTVRAGLSNNNADRNSIKDELRYIFAGLGEQFSVTDEELVDELLNFMMGDTVYYETDSMSTPLAICHSSMIRDVVSKIMYYFIKNFQIAGDSNSIGLRAPLKVISWLPGDPPPAGCENVDNSFFSTF